MRKNSSVSVAIVLIGIGILFSKFLDRIKRLFWNFKKDERAIPKTLGAIYLIVVAITLYNKITKGV